MIYSNHICHTIVLQKDFGKGMQMVKEIEISVEEELAKGEVLISIIKTYPAIKEILSKAHACCRNKYGQIKQLPQGELRIAKTRATIKAVEFIVTAHSGLERLMDEIEKNEFPPKEIADCFGGKSTPFIGKLIIGKLMRAFKKSGFVDAPTP